MTPTSDEIVDAAPDDAVVNQTTEQPDDISLRDGHANGRARAPARQGSLG
jgi:hypothetical protein